MAREVPFWEDDDGMILSGSILKVLARKFGYITNQANEVREQAELEEERLKIAQEH